MSAQVCAAQLFRYRSFHINKSQPLGHGSYGAVYKAKCDQLTCAAKVLHPTILDPLDPGAEKIMQRFKQECAFLESIRHPNIVQYLGMTSDPESKLPVLLMELLDESLTTMLGQLQTSLPYFVEVNICHDIALALVYLHSNDIIHRDLSSNNVLIMAKRRAKVTDFGMSRISSAAPTMTPLTTCPGTLAYMSPEALDEPPTYTKKLDCFSEGVLMIQVCTRLWPEPGPRTKTVEDPRSPTGTTRMPVLEPERRQNHINKIDHSHGLLPIAMDSLQYQEKERPSSEELCERLAGLQETSEYRKSMERTEREQNDMASQIQQLREQNKDLNKRQAEIQQTNHSLQRELEQLRRQLDQQIQLSTKPSQPPSPVAPEGRGSGTELQQHHPMKVKQSQPSPHQDQPAQKPHPPERKIVMLGEWKNGRKAPIEMSRGAVVVDGNVAYFMNWNGQTYTYKKKWSELPQCPCECCSLAVISGLLTAIGGRTPNSGLFAAVKDILGGGRQNKLLSIMDKKWVEHFPPMPTKRSLTAAIATQYHLIVAGGEDGSKHLNTMEVMDIQTQVWSTATSLPHPCSRASAAICGGHFCMLGGDGRTKSVLTCSLTNLLQSHSSLSEDSSHLMWNSISDAPVCGSTCVAVDGELLAVGGTGGSSAIYRYEPTSDSWDLISNMQTGRYNCLVAVLPSNEIMVVGGSDGLFDTNTVEVAKIQTS